MNTTAVKQYFGGVGSLFLLALPLMFTQIFNFSKGVVDTMMVGQVDEVNLAGMSLATSVYALAAIFAGGFSTAMMSILSKLHAQNNNKDIRYYFQQLLFFNIIISAVLFPVLYFSEWIFSFLNLQLETKTIASEYLQIQALAYVFHITSYGMRTLIMGMGKNKTVFIISLFPFFLNIPLNYAFIWGIEGYIEPMYAQGSAYSTLICLIADFLLSFFYLIHLKEINVFDKFIKPRLAEFRNIFKLGFPLSLGIIVEVGLFSVLIFLVARFGEVIVSANQIALNFTGMIFMLSLGLSLTVTQRVAFFTGLDDKESIKDTILDSICLSILISCMTISFTLVCREYIIHIYTSSSEVFDVAMKIMLVAVFYQLFDSLQIVALGVLRAYKLNKEAFKMALFSYWGIGLAGGEYLSHTQIEFYGYWIGLILCFVVLTSLYYRKVYKVVWLDRLN